MQPLGPYAPTMVVDGASLPISDYVELNGFNLASHTTALEQSVLGKPHLMPVNGLALMPPTVCGKRSRSNSDASSYSSSAASSHASVFSSENEGSESGYESQTSIGEQTPSSSRKSSMSEGASHQQLDNLAIWRADLLAAEQSERERCAKRIRDLQGEVVRLASEVVQVASQPAQPSVVAPAAATATASTSSISPASSSSSSSSSSEGTKNALVDCLVGKYFSYSETRALHSFRPPTKPASHALVPPPKQSADSLLSALRFLFNRCCLQNPRRHLERFQCLDFL